MHYLNHDYTQIASRLVVPSLASLRVFNNMCLLFKVLNGIMSCHSLLQHSCSLLQQITRIPSRCLRNLANNVFYQETHLTNYGIYFAMSRILRFGKIGKFGNEYSMLGFMGQSFDAFCHLKLAKTMILRYE